MACAAARTEFRPRFPLPLQQFHFMLLGRIVEQVSGESLRDFSTAASSPLSA